MLIGGCLALGSGWGWAQAPAGEAVIPQGTPMAVAIGPGVPKRLHQQLEGHLLYPVYVSNQLVLPASTRVTGAVVGMTPDGTHRLDSRLRGDFTPFDHAVVRFDTVVLGDGRHIPIRTGEAADGAPVFHIEPPAPAKGGFIRRQAGAVVQTAKDRIAVITGPDKKERLLRFVYSQLPYHPQRIESGTAWTVETAAAVTVPLPAAPAPPEEISPPPGADPSLWTIEATLKQPLDSAHATVGQPVTAIVARPVRDSGDGHVVVPTGAVLSGQVTRARAARRFGRPGVLRFELREITFPESHTTEQVQSSLASVDAVGGKDLTLDSEGRVKPRPKDKLVVPLLLGILATRPLDRDGGDNAVGKNAVASNSLGLVGFLVGTAGGWTNVASGIGFYGTALSIYNRWIKRGEETRFANDTRIVVKASVRRSPALPITGRARPSEGTGPTVPGPQ